MGSTMLKYSELLRPNPHRTQRGDVTSHLHMWFRPGFIIKYVVSLSVSLLVALLLVIVAVHASDHSDGSAEAGRQFPVEAGPQTPLRVLL